MPDLSLLRLGFNATVTLGDYITPSATSVPITPNTALPTSAIFPIGIVVGGEQIVANGATVSGANLVLTGCLRSVNGVVKEHFVGDSVVLTNPFRLTYGNASGRLYQSAVDQQYHTISEVMANILQPQGSMLAWMPCDPATDNIRTDAAWEQGQFSTFTNDDTSASRGFWYPNTAVGGPAYANADYHFRKAAGTERGYVETVLVNPYNSSYATQLWRTATQAGTDIPPTFYFGNQYRFGEVISFDNVQPVDDYGFTLHTQIYKTEPVGSRGPLVTFGAGRNLAHDSDWNWKVNLIEMAQFEKPLLTPITIPTSTWFTMEGYVVISDGADGRTGRLKIWHDGVLMIDYTGPTITDYWEKLGISWGVYTHMQSPSTMHCDMRECYLSTAPVTPHLIF